MQNFWLTFILLSAASPAAFAISPEEEAAIHEVRENLSSIHPDEELELWERLQRAALESPAPANEEDVLAIYRKVRVPESMKRHLVQMQRDSNLLTFSSRQGKVSLAIQDLKRRISGAMQPEHPLNLLEMHEISAGFVDAVEMIKNPYRTRFNTTFFQFKSLFADQKKPRLFFPTMSEADHQVSTTRRALRLYPLVVNERAALELSSARQYAQLDDRQSLGQTLSKPKHSDARQALQEILEQTRRYRSLVDFIHQFPKGDTQALMYALLSVPIQENEAPFSAKELQKFFDKNSWKRRAQQIFFYAARIQNAADMGHGFETIPSLIDIHAGYRYWRAFLKGVRIDSFPTDQHSFRCNGSLLRIE